MNEAVSYASAGTGAKRPVHVERRSDEARLEHGINRVLAPLDRAFDRSVAAAQATQRQKAIFRVVAAGDGFEFTRTLFGGGAGPSVERFGPYSTERAAHALAHRAAGRLLADDPRLVVGVVGLVAASRPAPRIHLHSVESVAPSCELCGKPTGYFRGQPRRFCAAVQGEKQSRCQGVHTQRVRLKKIAADPNLKRKRYNENRDYRTRDPAQKEKRLAYNRAYKAKQREYFEQLTDPKVKEQIRERWRLSSRKHQQKIASDPVALARQRERWRQQSWKRRGMSPPQTGMQPTGSVLLTASPRAEGFDLYARICAAVPASMPPELRKEIIGETALLVLEGAGMSAAVTQAGKNVRKSASPLRYTKPLEDCFWLADESQSTEEAYL